MRKTAPAESQSIVSRRVLVTIFRDQTTSTPRVVWAHEVPILEVIFGEGNIRSVDPSTMDEGYTTKISPELLVHNKRQDVIAPPSQSAGLDFVFTGDPQAEYERLVSCYGRHDEVAQSNCEYVYGRFSSGAFSRVIGHPTYADMPVMQLRQLVRDYGHQLPVATHDSTPEDRKTAEQALAAFMKLDKAALMKLAEEVGVEIAA